MKDTTYKVFIFWQMTILRDLHYCLQIFLIKIFFCLVLYQAWPKQLCYFLSPRGLQILPSKGWVSSAYRMSDLSVGEPRGLLKTAWQPNFSLYPILLPSLPCHRQWPQEHSSISLLHINLHHRACFLGYRTWDRNRNSLIILLDSSEILELPFLLQLYWCLRTRNKIHTNLLTEILLLIIKVHLEYFNSLLIGLLAFSSSAKKLFLKHALDPVLLAFKMEFKFIKMANKCLCCALIYNLAFSDITFIPAK